MIALGCRLVAPRRFLRSLMHLQHYEKRRKSRVSLTKNGESSESLKNLRNTIKTEENSSKPKKHSVTCNRLGKIWGSPSELAISKNNQGNQRRSRKLKRPRGQGEFEQNQISARVKESLWKISLAMIPSCITSLCSPSFCASICTGWL